MLKMVGLLKLTYSTNDVKNQPTSIKTPKTLHFSFPYMCMSVHFSLSFFLFLNFKHNIRLINLISYGNTIVGTCCNNDT